MKKALSLIIFVAMLFTMTACGATADNSSQSPSEVPSESNVPSSSSESEEPATQSEDATQTDDNNILVVYFSHTGNTETIASMVSDYTGGSLFEVKTVEVYPDDYDVLVDIAREEQDNNARPELSTHVENMDDYDVIFLGYPNWWGTIPMPMFTFLEEYNFAGKTIIPFCTHEGSALGRSENDIEQLCPDATLLQGLAIRGSSVDGAESDVQSWIDDLNLSISQ